jgi:ADP-ribose pyrophosphatase
MARDLSTAELNHEHGEVIEVHWEPLSEVLIWCDEGKITDAKTLVGLYRAAALLRE